ncbi:MAG: alpha-L-glutamate ligase-like protein [Deltaproteobacteria bacterium]
MFGIVRALREKGILCINKRNADYILRFNPRRLYPLVDDKLRTKMLAIEHRIAVPELYGVVQVEGQVRGVGAILDRYPEFVIKPARGSGGEGIVVVSGQAHGKYRKLLLTRDELNHHLFNVLSGMYSLGGQPDNALIEYRVRFDPIFEGISYLGVPDVRIIVFLGIPVMSMVRLPTKSSDGKANLHQGAVGAGIDMATGTTLSGVWGNDIVTEHPDTGQPVEGVRIPHWDELLSLAGRCQEAVGLGYIGVDIVLDRDKGPLILELNARPGLNIQIANTSGLLWRLKCVESHFAELGSLAERIHFAKEQFGINSTACQSA